MFHPPPPLDFLNFKLVGLQAEVVFVGASVLEEGLICVGFLLMHT